MELLVLKLVGTPLLIAAASLAGRRWGPAVAGWLVALPLTSGPVSVFLVLDHGAAFAAAATVGSLLGAAAEAAFALAYTRTATRGWVVALAAGSLGFGAVALAVDAISGVAPVLVFLGVLVVLAATLRAMPARAVFDAAAEVPAWDLPMRIVLGTALVVGITAVASFLGPAPSGLLAAYPVFAALLAVFAHRDQGAAAAVDVLHGLVLGLVAFAVFFVVLGWGLVALGPAPAFALAIAAALATHAVVLWRLTRGGARTDATAPTAEVAQTPEATTSG